MKRLAICGSHSRTREHIPWDDEGVEIWVLNEMPQAVWCKRWDVCFQIHVPEVYTSPNNWVEATHWEWLQRDHGDKVIYLQEVDPRVPNSRRYPQTEIFEAVPGAYLHWFKSSTVWAMAMAIYLGYEEVDFYGMDMASNTEYGYQLPNFQFWVGVMLGCGIKIGVLSNEQYFKDRMYGYEGEIQIERTFFLERQILLKVEKKKKDWNLEKVRNRLDDALVGRKFDQAEKLMVDFQSAAWDAGEMAGALSEAENYAVRDDLITRQQFEIRAAQAIQKSEEFRAKMHHASGKAEYILSVWRATGSGEILRQLRLLIGEMSENAYHTGANLGIHRENLFYLTETDKRIEAAGGMRSLKILERMAAVG